MMFRPALHGIGPAGAGFRSKGLEHMKRLVAGLALLAASTVAASAANPAANWTMTTLGDGTPLARVNVERKILDLTCAKGQSGAHALTYSIPMKFLDKEIYSLTEASAHATVSSNAGDIVFTLSSADAWRFQSSIATSDWVTISVSPAYDPAAPRLYGVTSYRTGGTAEVAMR